MTVRKAMLTRYTFTHTFHIRSFYREWKITTCLKVTCVQVSHFALTLGNLASAQLHFPWHAIALARLQFEPDPPRNIGIGHRPSVISLSLPIFTLIFLRPFFLLPFSARPATLFHSRNWLWTRWSIKNARPQPHARVSKLRHS